MRVNILGTEYKVIVDNYDDPELKGKNRMGYCFFDEREIHIEDFNTDDDWKDESDTAKENRKNIILRHEIVHAFLYESGLCQNSADVTAWATNEEMVDWIAIQFNKILKVFQEVGCL